MQFTKFLAAIAFTASLAVASPVEVSSSSMEVPHYVGCWSEVTGRVLHGKRENSREMTKDFCAKSCEGYQWFGLEYGRECYCSNNLAPGTMPTLEKDCDKRCRGDDKQTCGGHHRLSLYRFGPTEPQFSKKD